MYSKTIVFEGGECCGKSTIVRRLAEEYSAPFHKRVRTPGRFKMLTEVVNDIVAAQLRTSVVGSEALVFFDRWQAVSDIVYEKHCYKQKSILEPLMPTLADAMRKANIQIVYLKISEEEMLKRLSVRGDQLRTVEEAVKTRNAYDEFFRYGNELPYIIIDVTGMDKETAYRVVKEKLNLSGIEEHNKLYWRD